MDQSRYWIGKERTCLNSHVLSSFGDSWEEQAFAEDAAGPLGGCIWPPRSYTCSFCRREFRSAQALGGHMNVHRRDRARLKQISSPKRNQILEPNTSLGGCMLQYPDEICNPNFDLDHALYSSTTPRPSTASVLPPFTYSFAQDQQKSTPILSWSKLEPTKKIPISDYRNQKGCTKALDSNFTTIKENNNQIEVHIPGKSCLLGIRRRCEAPISDDKDDMENGLIFKKRRTDHDTRSFFPKAGHLVNGDQAESVASFEHSPTSTLENLDLELRLGDRP